MIISSFCAADKPQCVGAEMTPAGLVRVTNTHDTEHGSAHFTAEEWEVFLLGAKNGDFDLDKLTADLVTA